VDLFNWWNERAPGNPVQQSSQKKGDGVAQTEIADSSTNSGIFD